MSRPAVTGRPIQPLTMNIIVCRRHSPRGAARDHVFPATVAPPGWETVSGSVSQHS
jgi:hypothetical protein